MDNGHTVARLRQIEKIKREAMTRVIDRIAAAEEKLAAARWPNPLKAATLRKHSLQRYRRARADHGHAIVELQRHGVTDLEFLP